MKLRTNHFVVGIGCLALLACGMGWAQPAVAPFASPEAAGLNPLNFSNIDVAPGIEAGGGGGTREVGWDSIGFDPGTGDAEFVYFAFEPIPWCVNHRKVVSRQGVVHDAGGYLTDQGGDWQIDYVNSVIGVDPTFSPGLVFGGLQGDDTTGDYIFTSFAGDLDNAFGLAGGWRGYVEGTFNGGGTHTLAGAAYYPNAADDVCVFQRLDRDGGLVTPLTPGRNIPPGNINDDSGGVPGGSLFDNTVQVRIGGCAILSNGNNFYSMEGRGGSSGETFHGTTTATNYGTISDAAGAYINTTTGTFLPTNPAAPDGPVVSAGNGYIANGVTNLAVMDNNMNIFYTIDPPAVYDGSDLSLFPASDAGGIGAGWNSDDDETLVEAGPDIIYIPGRYTNAAGDVVAAIVRFQVNVGAQTVTPLPILTPMDDLVPPPSHPAENGRTTNCDTNEDGDLAVIYRNPDDNTVLARIYNADGTTRVGSFYVSATGANDNLEELYTVFDPVNQNFTTIPLGGATEIPHAGQTGGNAGKGAHSQIGFTKDGNGNPVIGALWLTTSSVASANTTTALCNAANKFLPVSHAARIISLGAPPPPPSGVDNWDLLN